MRAHSMLSVVTLFICFSLINISANALGDNNPIVDFDNLCSIKSITIPGYRTFDLPQLCISAELDLCWRVGASINITWNGDVILSQTIEDARQYNICQSREISSSPRIDCESCLLLDTTVGKYKLTPSYIRLCPMLKTTCEVNVPFFPQPSPTIQQQCFSAGYDCELFNASIETCVADSRCGWCDSTKQCLPISPLDKSEPYCKNCPGDFIETLPPAAQQSGDSNSVNNESSDVFKKDSYMIPIIIVVVGLLILVVIAAVLVIRHRRRKALQERESKGNINRDDYTQSTQSECEYDDDNAMRTVSLSTLAAPLNSTNTESDNYSYVPPSITNKEDTADSSSTTQTSK